MIKYGMLWVWKKTGERKMRKATRFETVMGIGERGHSFGFHTHIYQRSFDGKKYKCIICGNKPVII